MRRISDPSRGGFTLIELLIVVAIIGIIAAMLIPNMLSVMQKAKQKRTMGDQKLAGTAMMSWLTDQTSAAAAGAGEIFSFDLYSAIGYDELDELLVPQYAPKVPRFDGWNFSFEYRLNAGDPNAEQIMAIRSIGRDGTADGAVYTSGGFDSLAFDRDIVWADGFFVTWPQGLIEGY